MDTIDKPNEVARPKTYFEDVIGWVFLILGGYQVLTGAFDLVFSDLSEINGLMADPDVMTFIFVFPMMDFMLENVLLIMNAMLLFNLITVLCSIGLLKHWDWARLGFIVVMGINILQTLLVVFYIHVAYPHADLFVVENMASDEVSLFQNILLAVVIFFDFICVALILLYAWIAYRLGTEKIKARFRPDFIK